MSQLFRDFEVKHFWTFIGLEPTDFKLLQTYFLTEAASKSSHAKRSGPRIEFDIRRSKSSGIEPRLVMSGRRLHPVPRDDASRLEIWGIARADRSVRRYKDSLVNSFTRNPIAVQALPHAKHNEISIGLRIVLAGH